MYEILCARYRQLCRSGVPHMCHSRTVLRILLSIHHSAHWTTHRAIVVEKLCEYLQYKRTYESIPAKEDIPDFSERIPPEIVLELCVLPAPPKTILY